MNAPTGIINIRGKEYHTVAKRVADFREQHGDKYGLVTEIVSNDENVIVRALIIGRTDNFVVATGTAEENRKNGQINKTSALENCETSAIGRALAAFGIGGTEFASANEVQNAIHQQEGQSQGDDQGAVSPPASKAPAHSALKKRVRELVHEIHGIGDWETWVPFRETSQFQDVITDCQEKLPGWWEGWPEQPDGFTPLKDLIDQKETEFARAKADLINAG